ncbi:MAG: histidine phosphatase family protein [Elusimicrobiota bacterium]
MKLLIVRHAHAGDREDWAGEGKEDFARPLSRKGRKDMREAAAGLERLFPRPDALFTSPLLRAVETARILADAYGLDPKEVPALAQEVAPREALRWLSGRGEKILAVIGHEPGLGILAGLLLCGEWRPFLSLKKGQACLLKFSGRARAGTGTLLWSLTPKQLRRIP